MLRICINISSYSKQLYSKLHSIFLKYELVKNRCYVIDDKRSSCIGSVRMLGYRIWFRREGNFVFLSIYYYLSFVYVCVFVIFFSFLQIEFTNRFNFSIKGRHYWSFISQLHFWTFLKHEFVKNRCYFNDDRQSSCTVGIHNKRQNRLLLCCFAKNNRRLYTGRNKSLFTFTFRFLQKNKKLTFDQRLPNSISQKLLNLKFLSVMICKADVRWP